jgi:hypothetical protein
VRKGYKLNDIDIRHERIHTAQQREMLYVFFFLWYVIEWLIRLLLYRNAHKAYRNISLEREAYDMQYNLLYLDDRKHYAWVKYLKHYEATK